MVYIREAHAADSSWPVKYAEKEKIFEPKEYKERCTIADQMYKSKKLTIPCLVDGINNAVDAKYKGKPTRVYLVRTDGKLGVAGKPGPWGLKPALKEANDWLAEFKKSGKEPSLSDE